MQVVQGYLSPNGNWAAEERAISQLGRHRVIIDSYTTFSDGLSITPVKDWVYSILPPAPFI